MVFRRREGRRIKTGASKQTSGEIMCMEKETILISRYITSPYIQKRLNQHVCAEKRTEEEEDDIMENVAGLFTMCATRRICRRMDEGINFALCAML